MTKTLALTLALGGAVAAFCIWPPAARADGAVSDPAVGSRSSPSPEPERQLSSGPAASQLGGAAVAQTPMRENMGMGDDILGHVLFNQFEGRTNGPDNEFRWDGEAWIGTDMNRLWLKSEGFVENGKASDGITEALYDRPIPRLRYFDLQAGVRYDLDSNRGRTWGAIGVEGLAPYFFEFEPTFYFSDGGRVAGRINGSYDILFTNRLVLQPQFELNMYNKSDPSHGIGSGVSELDTGLRLRYEISRKFAPYIGVAYAGKFGETADFTREEGGIVNDVRFIFGIRFWY